MTYKAKHQPCACGCGEMADECMTGRRPLGAFTLTATSDLSEVYREPATCPTCGGNANPGPPVWCQRCDEPATS